MRKCAGNVWLCVCVYVCVRVRAHVHHGNYSTARRLSGVPRRNSTLICVFRLGQWGEEDLAVHRIVVCVTQNWTRETQNRNRQYGRNWTGRREYGTRFGFRVIVRTSPIERLFREENPGVTTLRVLHQVPQNDS